MIPCEGCYAHPAWDELGSRFLCRDCLEDAGVVW